MLERFTDIDINKYISSVKWQNTGKVIFKGLQRINNKQQLIDDYVQRVVSSTNNFSFFLVCT